MAQLVSVVIPTHNRAGVVADAVHSAFAQTHTPMETVVVDDGSTDDTLGVLQGLAAIYGSALKIVHQKNTGAPAARNAGCDAAAGAFINFLDSDDVLHPEKVALQLAALARVPDAATSFCHGTLEMQGGEEDIGPDLGENPLAYVEELCGRAVHVVQTSSPLWRADFLSHGRRWDEAISLGDDLEFHVRCLADAKRVVFVPRHLFRVRHHGGDRLSDFSADDSRLASLLITRERVYEALAARGLWSPACARNAAAAMRSLYVNYLRRMPNDHLARLERAVALMGLGGALACLVRVRQVIGRRTTLALLEHTVYLSGTFLRRMLSRVRRGLVRRSRAIERLRPIDAITTARSLTSPELRRPKKASVLLVELNEFHIETLPGYVLLFAAAGYRTTILHRPRVDITGALCRLSEEDRPVTKAATLLGMKAYLRSAAPARFDVVAFNTGTIVEPFGYFGGVLDYLGCLPEGRVATFVVEHSDKTLLSRGDLPRLVGRLFALRPMRVQRATLPMLAPVDFGAARKPTLTVPLRFVAVGRMMPAYRHVAGLVDAISSILAGDNPPFELHIIGEGTFDFFPEVVRKLIRFHGRLPFEAMYNVVEDAHIFLPLLESEATSHLDYLTGNTSGSRQLVLGFEKVSVWERPFAEAYGFNEESALIYEPGRLVEGFKAALALDEARFDAIIAAVAAQKRMVFEESLANLKAHLAARRECA